MIKYEDELDHEINVTHLARRLENAAKIKFGGDLRKALVYLQLQYRFYSEKAEKAQTRYSDRWRKVSTAYWKAWYNTEYYLSVDNELFQETMI